MSVWSEISSNIKQIVQQQQILTIIELNHELNMSRHETNTWF